jgi:hypothetical protein
MCFHAYTVRLIHSNKEIIEFSLHPINADVGTGEAQAADQIESRGDP